MTHMPAARERQSATLEEVRALAHPLRLRIIRLTYDRSLTNKELASELGENPATVLHHVRTLLRTGFLEPDRDARPTGSVEDVVGVLTARELEILRLASDARDNEEIAIVLNELRVGSSVDQALLSASARAQSPAFDSGVSALLVGQKVGGDLPKILETSAATLREMNRLEGVVQSKTSESRAQLWVLAGFPLGIVFLFSSVSPGFFDPLAHTFVGKLVSLAAVVLWLGAIILARQLSKVDL